MEFKNTCSRYKTGFNIFHTDVFIQFLVILGANVLIFLKDPVICGLLQITVERAFVRN